MPLTSGAKRVLAKAIREAALTRRCRPGSPIRTTAISLTIGLSPKPRSYALAGESERPRRSQRARSPPLAVAWRIVSPMQFRNAGDFPIRPRRHRIPVRDSGRQGLPKIAGSASGGAPVKSAVVHHAVVLSRARSTCCAIPGASRSRFRATSTTSDVLLVYTPGNSWTVGRRMARRSRPARTSFFRFTTRHGKADVGPDSVALNYSRAPVQQRC